MFPLINGNPEQKPASTTRFVLPFAYQLSPGQAWPHFYEPLAFSATAWGESCLAPEAGGVAFSRARWFKVKWSLYNRLEGKLALRDGRRIRAALSPPQMVLFEYPKAGDSATADVLRTGLLIVELYFPEDKERVQLEDLLEVNELFSQWRQGGGGDANARFGRLLKSWPAGIAGGASQGGDIFTRHWQDLLNLPIQTGDGQWLRVIPSSSGDWRLHADDHSYVWSCALLQGGGGALGKAFPQPKDRSLAGCYFGHWIKLLNVQGPGATAEQTHASRRFERELAAQASYPRWDDAGTFCGFTARSAVLLGGVSTAEGQAAWSDFGRVHFGQALLLLYVRTSLLRLSRRLAEMSAQARDAGGGSAAQDAFCQDFAGLRGEFAYFANLYAFLPPAQGQASAETYGLARKAMEIDALYGDLQRQIQGSQECLASLAPAPVPVPAEPSRPATPVGVPAGNLPGQGQSGQNAQATDEGRRLVELGTLLAVTATALLTAGLAAAILGMNVFVAEWRAALGDGLLAAAVLLGSMSFALLCVVLARPLAYLMRTLSGLGGKP